MNRIKELRCSLGLTQAELGEKVGLNQTAIGKYEREQLEPTIETLKKMSAIFECSIDYLINNSDDFGNITIKKENFLTDNLSEEEKKLLEDYRSLSPALQEMLQATICTWKSTNANTIKKK